MPEKLDRRRYLRGIGATGIGGLTLLAGCSGGDGGGDGGDGDGGDGGGDDGGGDGGDGGGGQNPTEWVVGASQEGSPANTWVQGMASEISEHSNKLRWSPQFVNGFRAGLVLLNDGELDVASSWFHNAYQAQNDLGGFAEDGDVGPLDKDIRAMLPVMHQGFWFYATYADRDDIQTIRDLEGMTVGLNVPGAGVSVWGEQQFELMGIADSITFEFLSLGDVGNALQSRQVDAALQLAVNGSILPTSEARAWSSVTMKGVEIPEDVRQQHQQQNELVQFGVVNNEDLNQQGDFDSVHSMLLASSQFTTAERDADLVYEAVKVLVENENALAEYHPAMNLWGLEDGKHKFEGAIEGTVFHEGAKRYYDENGIDYPGQ
jgi:hypothetical protein